MGGRGVFGEGGVVDDGGGGGAEEGVGFGFFDEDFGGCFEGLVCFGIGGVLLVVVGVVVSGWEGRVWVVEGVGEEAVGAAVRLRLPGFVVGMLSLVGGMVSVCDQTNR